MIEKYLVKKITEPVDWKVTVPGIKEHDEPRASFSSAVRRNGARGRRPVFR